MAATNGNSKTSQHETNLKHENFTVSTSGLWSRKSRYPTPTPGNFDYLTPIPTPTPIFSCISHLKVVILFRWIHNPYLHFPGIRKLV